MNNTRTADDTKQVYLIYWDYCFPNMNIIHCWKFCQCLK